MVFVVVIAVTFIVTVTVIVIVVITIVVIVTVIVIHGADMQQQVLSPATRSHSTGCRL